MEKWMGFIAIIIFCSIAILSVVSDGAGLRNGWDLEDAHASFVGEADADRAGSRLAGAGDVNGDGYDDFLISAWRNDDGGSEAGKVYLFFGQSSGWLMDINLSKADASFLGEAPGDSAGIGLAAAGDVNGDGYDDILIGAALNDEASDDAGQVYLILGRATGWSKDVDLSNANASFLGRETTGIALAGAGDVNGDGYDDILIGSHEYGDEGLIDLIFGKADNWSMDSNLDGVRIIGDMLYSFCGHFVDGLGDVNGDGYDDIGFTASGKAFLLLGRPSGWNSTGYVRLADCDASYVKEAHGHNVDKMAGAGDVNGDGLADILISDDHNNEPGPSFGQTYLVMGRKTGWSLNTSLSQANASFWGSSGKDLPSWIATAGDMNGDGYDEILIGCYANGEAANTAGKTFLFLGKATGWSMDMNLSDSDASFLGEEARDRSGWCVDSVGDVNGDGYDGILIGADASTTGSAKRGKVYLILYDDEPPGILTDNTPSNATTGEVLPFNVTVIDNMGILNVTIEYWYGASTEHTNISLDLISGDHYNCTWVENITVRWNFTGNLHYIIHVIDKAAHETVSSRRDVLVIDNDPPVFEEDTTPSVATTGDELAFMVQAMDNINLSVMRVEYWFGESNTHSNVTMIRASDVQWILTIDIRPDSLEPIHYLFYAADNSSNFNVTAVKDIPVRDNDPPTFVEDASDTSATTGDPFDFLVNVTDNIKLSDVRIMYWFGDPDKIENVSMEDGNDDLWSLTIMVPSDSLDTLHYYFYAVDNSSNFDITDTRNVTVADNDLPFIGSDSTSKWGTTGDPFNFSVEVHDNIGIDEVWVHYAHVHGNGTVLYLTPIGHGLWEGTITLEDTLEDLVYNVRVTDTSGNENAPWRQTVEMVDNDLPELIEDLTPSTATTGDPFEFEVYATDNLGMVTVSVFYWYGEGHEVMLPIQQDDDGYWRGTLVIDHVIDTLHYEVEVSDASQNTVISPEVNVTIIDNDAPTIDFELPFSGALKGSRALYGPEATDNIGVVRIHIVYRFGDDTPVNETVEDLIRVTIPRHPEGSLYFRFSAVDAAGNWATTEEYNVSLVNLPPEIDDLPTWEVLEETDAELDLAPYVTDPNDEVLTVSCSDESITIEGMVLKLRHDAAVPDRTVTITVMDPEDQTDADLTIHVVNVNDAPVITDVYTSPKTKFKVDEKVTFVVNVTDEDLDELTVTWKDGETVLGTGETFMTQKLKPGKRTITVTVSDGEATVEDSIEVVIVKEEESPGFNIVIFMFAVVSAAMIAISRRNTCRVRSN